MPLFNPGISLTSPPFTGTATMNGIPIHGLNTGTSTQNGVSLKVAFTIAHGLGAVPSYVNVSPNSVAASALFTVSCDATNITVTFLVAPAIGTNNVVLNWLAVQ